MKKPHHRRNPKTVPNTEETTVLAKEVLAPESNDPAKVTEEEPGAIVVVFAVAVVVGGVVVE